MCCKPRTALVERVLENVRHLKKCDLRGKDVLVVGCGFGDDALRIAKLGANVTSTSAWTRSILPGQWQTATA
jgi:2-polyprenyl-3-methyl-5-hydroxy-6-metoxy-1,4-benzoquinol methylase